MRQLFGYRKVRVRKHEIALWFQHGDLYRVLEPGEYLVSPYGQNEIETFNTLETKFEHKLQDVLIQSPELAKRLVVVDNQDHQRSMIWRDGRLFCILGPGRHLFWQAPLNVEVETFDVNDFVFEHEKIEAILGHKGGSLYLEGVRVEAHERVILYREGELFRELGPGMHIYWKHAGRITFKSVDLREQSLDISGQEIMTADKVTLRINLVVNYKVVDPQQAVNAVKDYETALYRQAQLILREAVGERQLDKLLADKNALGEQLAEVLKSRGKSLGLQVGQVGVKDIILPGDMKGILNEVILAQKQAEANLIRRREETAAARSQVNTAKLLADNPYLSRMKELEQLQEILAGVKATFVLGKGDLLEQVRTLVKSSD